MSYVRKHMVKQKKTRAERNAERRQLIKDFYGVNLEEQDVRYEELAKDLPPWKPLETNEEPWNRESAATRPKESGYNTPDFGVRALRAGERQNQRHQFAGSFGRPPKWRHEEEYMAGEVKHDYHLVDPSPWPAVGSLAVLIMMVSAVFFMKPDALLFGIEGKLVFG